MFDIAFSELMIISIVALLVIGPERLPKVGAYIRHCWVVPSVTSMTSNPDINREMQLDERKNFKSQVTDSAQILESSVRKGFESTKEY